MQSTERTTTLVNRWLDSLDGETTPLAGLFVALEQRSFGGVIILLAILGLLPGISIGAGIAIIIIAIQMLFSYPSPRLPGFITQREISTDRLRRTMHRPLVYLTRLEQTIKPRWRFLTRQRATKCIAVLIVLLALVMITPLPLSNLLPAIALLLIALGLLERDGALVAAGFVASIVALAVGSAMIGILYRLLLGLVG
ncbi:MAG: exopolysaccharide biosynthesis protein [Gammaproteobacteria bacterium]|nr:exopolysaccharide biosynthesis protein [Gammaproteobacteria bacterium]